MLDGIEVEVPLAGTLIVIRNDDTPGVIGEVGSILGRHRVNIITFALGSGPEGGIGVASVETRDKNDRAPMVTEEILKEIRSVSAVRQAALVNL